MALRLCLYPLLRPFPFCCVKSLKLPVKNSLPVTLVLAVAAFFKGRDTLGDKSLRWVSATSRSVCTVCGVHAVILVEGECELVFFCSQYGGPAKLKEEEAFAFVFDDARRRRI